MDNGGLCILQIFNVHVREMLEMIPKVSNLGISHILISPVQEHCVHLRHSPWYRVYQPSSEKIGNSLGTKIDYLSFIKSCKEANISVIVDVVLHHRSYCPLCNWAQPFKFVQNIFSTKISLEYDSSDPRYNYRNWGYKEYIDSMTVLEKHSNFLRELIEMGFGGFRFDAAKHIPSPYLQLLMEKSGASKISNFLSFCEVLDHNESICSEYLFDNMKVINFPFTFQIISSLSFGGDIRKCVEREFLPYNRIVNVADCHDSILGDAYKFGDRKDSLLGISIILGLGRGIPFVYFDFLDDDIVRSALRFYLLTHGLEYSVDMKNSSPNTLVIRRGSKGLFILNKSGDWLHDERMYFEGLQNGVYIELKHNFSVHIHNSEIIRWDDDSQRGVRIGPRDVLFFWTF